MDDVHPRPDEKRHRQCRRRSLNTRAGVARHDTFKNTTDSLLDTLVQLLLLPRSNGVETSRGLADIADHRPDRVAACTLSLRSTSHAIRNYEKMRGCGAEPLSALFRRNTRMAHL